MVFFILILNKVNLTFSRFFFCVYLQCCDLLEGLIPGKDDKSESGQVTPKHYERLYVFTLMWSIGAFLELDDRAKMEELIRTNEEFTLDLPDVSESDATMFDFYVDGSGELSYKSQEFWTKNGGEKSSCFHLFFYRFIPYLSTVFY